MKQLFKMKYIYMILFWSFSLLTAYLVIICMLSDNYELIKNVSLPLLGIIFTVGQLWHNEKKQEFEEQKYVQSRKDLYFDKKVEIALGINKYTTILGQELAKPFFKKEMEFNHAHFLFTTLEFYTNVVDKAKFLFDDKFIDEIRKLMSLMGQIQNEIQIMQNHLMLSERHRDSNNFKTAESNFYVLYKQLNDLSDKIANTCVEEINIRNDIYQKAQKHKG
ncbi:MAG: hypothetical protein NC200_01495 [Candidatus Gastranaerophilales bacterium]|nr:hypothetical protein [Candidatus Gastranaerophilales bacterium]